MTKKMNMRMMKIKMRKAQHYSTKFYPTEDLFILCFVYMYNSSVLIVIGCSLSSDKI